MRERLLRVILGFWKIVRVLKGCHWRKFHTALKEFRLLDQLQQK